MVRPSFVPPPPVRVLREMTRYRKTQIVARAQEIQRLDKVLQDAGIKISSVASTVLGKSNPGHDRGTHRRRAGSRGACRNGEGTGCGPRSPR